MAVIGMAARDDDAVGTSCESLQQEHEVDAARAWETNDFYVRGIFDTACAGQVCACIRTPVAYE